MTTDGRRTDADHEYPIRLPMSQRLMKGSSELKKRRTKWTTKTILRCLGGSYDVVLSIIYR